MTIDGAVWGMIGMGLLETLYMTLVSTLLSYVLGLPLGVILVVTQKGGIMENLPLNGTLNVIVNILRSVPFLIMLILVIPITRFIVGTTIGSTATIVPLVIAAFPFIARLVESSLKEVDYGVIEAAKSMGAGNFTIIRRVMLPEARPSLIVGCAIAVTTILSYSAMAGICGGGGLGAIAINYGFYKYESGIMILTVILLVMVVQAFQEVGTRLAARTDKRERRD